MAAQIIQHEGIVEKTIGNQVYVKLMVQSACESCHSKSGCSVSGQKDKTVIVNTTDADNYKPNQGVIVSMKGNVGTTAVILSYVVPLFLLLLTLTITSNWLSELLSGIIAIAILVPYYLILMVFRKKFEKSFSFWIEKM